MPALRMTNSVPNHGEQYIYIYQSIYFYHFASMHLAPLVVK